MLKVIRDKKRCTRRLDENALAAAVVELEGGAECQSIAQVKETVRHTLDLLRDRFEDDPAAVIGTLTHKPRRR